VLVPVVNPVILDEVVRECPKRYMWHEIRQFAINNSRPALKLAQTVSA
jgi:hypothetical protein